MLLDLIQLHEKYSLNIRGTIHVGAHFGQELEIYEKLNVRDNIFFEPVSTTYNILNANIGNKAIVVNKAVGNENRKITMNIETANAGQSSSILTPKLHLVQRPDIVFHGIEEVDMIRLDDFLTDAGRYNFLNIDVQGYELEVLKGASNILNGIDYIMTEINRDEVYENCAMIDDIIEFLKPYGFELVETNWAGGTWGDGLFIKR